MFKLKLLFIQFITGFFLAGILVQGTQAQTAPAKIIPEFKFLTLSGQSFTRNELKKNKTLVIIFFDVTCDHCQHEIAAIGEHINEFKQTEFYLVSMDEVTGIKKFMNSFGKKLNGRSNVTLLRDVYKQFIVRFLPKEFPALYVYGPDLKLRKYFGQNSDVKEIVKTVNQQ